METLANLRKKEQDFGKGDLWFEDEAIGYIKTNSDEWRLPWVLSKLEVEKINSTRVNKDKYKHKCDLPEGFIRYGKKIVEELIQKSFDYYSSKSPHDWAKIDFKDVTNYTWMALESHDGKYDPRNRTVIDSEPHFDFVIDEDWAEFYYHLPNGQEVDGKLGIKGTIDLVTDIGDNCIEIIDWKGLPTDTLIPTIDGWKTMGTLLVGDIIFDEFGNQTKIIGKSNLKYKDCYKIYFDDKTTAISDDEHLWKLNDGSIVSTLELKHKDRINIAKPIQNKDLDLPIDPYVLGVWLGDGRNRNSEISNNDNFIFEEIEKRGFKVGKNIGGKNRCQSRTIFELKKELKKLNLLHNKHIPKIYLRASYNQRLDLLRGLMDSDGSVNKTRKQAVFTNCSQKLSNSVKELLLSLGQRVNQVEVENRQFQQPIKVYPIHFKPININPFLLPRKHNQIKEDWGTGNSHRRLIKKIEYVGKMETQCIMVDSPTNTYLCTENFIPTHNTGQRLNWGTGKIKEFDDFCKDTQLMLYYYAARRLYPDADGIQLTINYIRHGGPFTIPFDDSILKKVENLLREKFNEIRNCEIPKMLDERQRDFRCNKLCSYYKNKMGNSNQCKVIHEMIKRDGIDKVTAKMIHPNHKIGHYQSPGE